MVAKPFVKWAGGKTQLLDAITASFPADLMQRAGVTYVEPFVGGGAVLFHMLQKFPNIERAIINDINPQLICTYRMIKEDVEPLLMELDVMQSEYISRGPEERIEYFLAKRDQYNSRPITDLQIASLFIFLNRTCFNGLYRVNSKGYFNVPHGKYANPKICDLETLLADSKLLQNVEILCGDFSLTRQYAGFNTIYYFDPPYRPLTQTAAFTSYTKGGFDDNEQRRLGRFIQEIAEAGSFFVASNSDPKNVNPEDAFFDDLYTMFQVKRVSAARMINSDASGRGAVSEIMVTNAL